MIVSELYIHPVKSMRGQRVEEAHVTAAGLEGDRIFAVVPANRDTVLTAREKPVLVAIAPRMEDGYLILEGEADSMAVSLAAAGNRRDVRVWSSEVDGLDMGDEVADWLSAQVGKPVRLLASTSESRRRSDVSIVPDSFVDLAPLLVTSAESLSAINRGLEQPITQRRFRPNIVVSGLARPFDEDAWVEIEIGDQIRLEIAFGCARCVLPDVDDDTAVMVRDMPVNAALKAVRLGADGQTYFGQNARMLQPGRIKVGDPVRVLAVRDSQLLQAEGKAAFKA